jgi:hypothetical protein
MQEPKDPTRDDDEAQSDEGGDSDVHPDPAREPDEPDDA